MSKNVQFKDTAKGKGVRTAIQTVGGVILGLFTTVWAVDGVPEAVMNYLSTEAIILVGTSSVFAGVIGYLMNRK
jgi:hypothetical protein